MTIPNAPTEGGGSKLMFLVYDNTGTNAAAILRAIKTATINGEVVGHMAVASHADGDVDGGTEPGVLLLGSDGSNVYTLTVDSAGRLVIQGGAAHGATAAGNPVQVGAVYRSADPSLTNGQMGSLLIDTAGRVKVVGAAADDAAVAGNPILIGAIYQATPTEVDDGDTALLRSTIRRALVSGADISEVAMAAGVAITDTNDHDYQLDITEGWRSVSLAFENTHDQAFTVSVLLGVAGAALVTAYTASDILAATTGVLFIGAGAAATGAANYVAMPALAYPTGSITVRVVAGSAPASGTLTITAICRS